jgi:hypothetical protein
VAGFDLTLTAGCAEGRDAEGARAGAPADSRSWTGVEIVNGGATCRSPTAWFALR